MSDNKQIFVLEVRGGEYDDAWSRVEASSFSVEKLEKLQEKLQAENVRAMALDGIIRKWNSEFNKNNPLVFEPMVDRPSWPSGIGKNQITDEMRAARTKVDLVNKKIAERNNAAMNQREQYRVEMLKKFIAEQKLEWQVLWNTEEDIGSYYYTVNEHFFDIYPIDFLGDE